jgi:hypothetical protein
MRPGQITSADYSKGFRVIERTLYPRGWPDDYREAQEAQRRVANVTREFLRAIGAFRRASES